MKPGSPVLQSGSYADNHINNSIECWWPLKAKIEAVTEAVAEVPFRHYVRWRS